MRITTKNKLKIIVLVIFIIVIPLFIPFFRYVQDLLEVQEEAKKKEI